MIFLISRVAPNRGQRKFYCRVKKKSYLFIYFYSFPLERLYFIISVVFYLFLRNSVDLTG